MGVQSEMVYAAPPTSAPLQTEMVHAAPAPVQEIAIAAAPQSEVVGASLMELVFGSAAPAIEGPVQTEVVYEAPPMETEMVYAAPPIPDVAVETVPIVPRSPEFVSVEGVTVVQATPVSDLVANAIYATPVTAERATQQNVVQVEFRDRVRQAVAEGQDSFVISTEEAMKMLEVTSVATPPLVVKKSGKEMGCC